MAANLSNIKPDQSTIPMAPVGEDKVIVTIDKSNNKVKLELGGKTSTVSDETDYSKSPFNISVVNKDGTEPLFSNFGSLFDCNGGVLTVNNKQYEIVVKEKNRRLDYDAQGKGGIAIVRADLIREIRLAANPSDAAVTPIFSPAQLGRHEMNNAAKEGIISNFAPVANEAPMFVQADIEWISGRNDEQELVAFFTPLLQAVIDEVNGQDAKVNTELVLVNCEEYAWLGTASETSRYDKKPDLIICHPAYIKEKPPSAAKPPAENLRTDDFRFGVAANKCLNNSLAVLLEAKVTIGENMQSIGEVINYGRLLAYKIPISTTGRAVLFDKTQFWLFLFRGGALAQVIKCEWTTPGSRDLFKAFISHKSNWTQVLEAACAEFGVQVASANSFLGYGAFGRVFRVRRLEGDDQSDLALKIVLDENDAPLNLDLEHDYILRTGQEEPALVPGIDARGTERVEGGAAMLLTTVGRPIDSVAEYCDRVILALVSLHKRRICHGDPRLSNAIIVGRGEIVWIDFMMTRFDEPSTARFVQDMKVLVKSLFDTSSVPESIGPPLSAYNPQVDATVDALIAVILRSF